MKKAIRQAKIKELIANQQVERQEDMVRLLLDEGIQVTQATVSRDIKEMQLVKVPSVGGGYHYSLPIHQGGNRSSQLADTLKHGLISLKRSDRFLSLALKPGNGPVAAMLIKQMNYPEVFTAIGDDTSVLVVCQSAADAGAFERKLTSLQ